MRPTRSAQKGTLLYSAPRHRRPLITAATATAALLTLPAAGCAKPADTGDARADRARSVEIDPAVAASASGPGATPSASATASASGSPSASPKASASRRASATPGGTTSSAARPDAPDFPVPVSLGDATQVITVKASGSYATVTAWAKTSAGWKSAITTTAGRVGSNGVVDGATRTQNTYTTPGGTYTITEGFGIESGGTAMPYTRVNDTHWWVQDPESQYYNSMHTAAGADFPLTETGDRGSEHLINYPVQYAKALVINFNRWPAVPGRGAGIFLHVNGSGATAGCVSVPRATMDQIMAWIRPGAHPRIAIG
ncbi:L,D-transpeptidase family protein [Streptomyces sp. NPDC051940]|uniref:L,D-transpeptidase family protein n=1 Tax=Streptomyces sp. NPDC051940 TaxID=3155675 RepID=UPI00341403D3